NPFRPADRDTIFQLARQHLVWAARDMAVVAHAEQGARQLLTGLFAPQGNSALQGILSKEGTRYSVRGTRYAVPVARNATTPGQPLGHPGAAFQLARFSTPGSAPTPRLHRFHSAESGTASGTLAHRAAPAASGRCGPGRATGRPRRR